MNKTYICAFMCFFIKHNNIFQLVVVASFSLPYYRSEVLLGPVDLHNPLLT